MSKLVYPLKLLPCGAQNKYLNRRLLRNHGYNLDQDVFKKIESGGKILEEDSSKPSIHVCCQENLLDISVKKSGACRFAF